MRCPTLKQELDHQAVDNRNLLLTISSFEEDHLRLGHVFGESNWTVRGVRTRREATVLMRQNPPPVVICERDLPDGNWKDILDELILLARPPSLIVISRLADEYLWVEVLNLGGYDVLAKPLAEKEVRWAVDSASRHWDGKRDRPSGSRRPSLEQEVIPTSASGAWSDESATGRRSRICFTA